MRPIARTFTAESAAVRNKPLFVVVSQIPADLIADAKTKGVELPTEMAQEFLTRKAAEKCAASCTFIGATLHAYTAEQVRDAMRIQR